MVLITYDWLIGERIEPNVDREQETVSKTAQVTPWTAFADHMNELALAVLLQ